jgi:hypothetical protein
MQSFGGQDFELARIFRRVFGKRFVGGFNGRLDSGRLQDRLHRAAGHLRLSAPGQQKWPQAGT